MSTQTPNMSLYQPQIGVDSGLVWEQQMNANSSTVDQHNHSAGSGVQITPSGMMINADLPFQGNNAISLRSVRLSAQASPISGSSDLGCVYVSGVDLYYNDENGNQVRITSGGTVNATSSGISSGTASASFSSGVLVVNSSSNAPANIQCASLLMGNTGVSGSFYLTLSPPSSLASNYSLTLPPLPAQTNVVVLGTDGTLATITYPNLSSQVIPPGLVAPYAGNSDPIGWLICNGQAVSRTTFANLFGVISTTYGSGNGSTTFNVPTLTDSAPFGSGNLFTYGAAGGSATSVASHTHTDSGHGHGINQAGAVYVQQSGQNASGGSGAFSPGINPSGISIQTGAANIQSTGVTNGNMPPFVAMLYIIKT